MVEGIIATHSRGTARGKRGIAGPSVGKRMNGQRFLPNKVCLISNA